VAHVVEEVLGEFLVGSFDSGRTFEGAKEVMTFLGRKLRGGFEG